MNAVTYNLLNKVNDHKELNEESLENIYQYYLYLNRVLKFQTNITENDFKQLFNIIYDVLRFKISDEEFECICEHYLKLLAADAVDQKNINVSWFIHHIWYLSVGISDDIDVEKYRDCILFLQQRLIKEFGIGESLKESISRKLYTNCLNK